MTTLLDIKDLFTSLSVDSIKSTLLTTWATLDLKVTAWPKTGKARTILAIVSQVLSSFTQVQAEFIKAGFLETATGIWLKYLAKASFDVDYIPAQAGEELLTLTNSTASAYGDYAVGELRFANAVTGKTYHNRDVIAVDAIAASGDTDITVVADETGTASNAAPGEITEIVAPALLGVTCTNIGSLVGVDEENDSDLRQRCRDKKGTLSPNGPKQAYSFVSKTPELNGGVTVTRTKIIRDNAAGTVHVVIASADGGIGGNYTTPGTDVYKVHQGLLTWAVPQCVTLITESADEITQDITAHVWVYTDYSLEDATIELAISTALLAWFAQLPIGGDIKVEGGTGYIFQNAIEGVIKSAVPAHQVEVSLPATNMAMADIDVASAGTITITVTQVIRATS